MKELLNNIERIEYFKLNAPKQAIRDEFESLKDNSYWNRNVEITITSADSIEIKSKGAITAHHHLSIAIYLQIEEGKKSLWLETHSAERIMPIALISFPMLFIFIATGDYPIWLWPFPIIFPLLIFYVYRYQEKLLLAMVIGHLKDRVLII